MEMLYQTLIFAHNSQKRSWFHFLKHEKSSRSTWVYYLKWSKRSVVLKRLSRPFVRRAAGRLSTTFGTRLSPSVYMQLTNLHGEDFTSGRFRITTQQCIVYIDLITAVSWPAFVKTALPIWCKGSERNLNDASLARHLAREAFLICAAYLTRYDTHEILIYSWHGSSGIATVLFNAFSTQQLQSIYDFLCEYVLATCSFTSRLIYHFLTSVHYTVFPPKNK